MKRAKIVFGKEIADNLRDRRSVLTAFFYALIGPIVLVPMLLFESRTLDRGTTKTIRVAVEGADEAPGLVEYLRQRSIETRPAPADPAQAVRDLEVDLVLVIPRGYADDFRADLDSHGWCPLRSGAVVLRHRDAELFGERHRQRWLGAGRQRHQRGRRHLPGGEYHLLVVP